MTPNIHVLPSEPPLFFFLEVTNAEPLLECQPMYVYKSGRCVGAALFRTSPPLLPWLLFQQPFFVLAAEVIIKLK